MRIRIKRQPRAALKPVELVDYLFYELNLNKNTAFYQPLEPKGYGIIRITQKRFDKQRLGPILLREGYIQVTDIDIPKPKEKKYLTVKRILRKIGNKMTNRTFNAISDLEQTLNGGKK